MHMKSALPSHNIASQIIGILRLESAWLCHCLGLWAGTIISEEPAASISRVDKELCWLATKLGVFVAVSLKINHM